MKLHRKPRRGWIAPADPREARTQQARIILRSASRRLCGSEIDELRHVAGGGQPRMKTFKSTRPDGSIAYTNDWLFQRLCTEFAELF